MFVLLECPIADQARTIRRWAPDAAKRTLPGAAVVKSILPIGRIEPAYPTARECGDTRKARVMFWLSSGGFPARPSAVIVSAGGVTSSARWAAPHGAAHRRFCRQLIFQTAATRAAAVWRRSA